MRLQECCLAPRSIADACEDLGGHPNLSVDLYFFMAKAAVGHQVLF